MLDDEATARRDARITFVPPVVYRSLASFSAIAEKSLRDRAGQHWPMATHGQRGTPSATGGRQRVVGVRRASELWKRLTCFRR